MTYFGPICTLVAKFDRKMTELSASKYNDCWHPYIGEWTVIILRGHDVKTIVLQWNITTGYKAMSTMQKTSVVSYFLQVCGQKGLCCSLGSNSGNLSQMTHPWHSEREKMRMKSWAGSQPWQPYPHPAATSGGSPTPWLASWLAGDHDRSCWDVHLSSVTFTPYIYPSWPISLSNWK